MPVTNWKNWNARFMMQNVSIPGILLRQVCKSNTKTNINSVITWISRLKNRKHDGLGTRVSVGSRTVHVVTEYSYVSSPERNIQSKDIIIRILKQNRPLSMISIAGLVI